MKKIFSLNMICYLRCLGHKEIDVGFNNNTKKVYFVFEDSEEVSRVIDEYRKSDTMVNLHQYITEFKKLKDEMYRYTQQFK